ncbi:MAG: hypothetical protein LBI81_02490 [Puniceicoccales bacterium]|jgi:hypothetical protein|nr:hypothetical protein [Puniceicoccales bacterium]
MATYTGEIHAAAFGFDMSDGIRDREIDSQVTLEGPYEGAKADLHEDSKSMIALALEMDDCPTDDRINRDRLVDRDIREKKKVAEKQKIFSFYINRLDRHRGTKRYSDYENKLNRLKHQITFQSLKSPGKTGEKNLTFNGEDLAEFILRDLSLDFDEVTEQDNVLELLQKLEDFECEAIRGEIVASKKMLRTLQGKENANFNRRIEDLKEKIQTLEEQVSYSPLFKQAFADAQKKLRKSHAREIEDGYNLIPKAADLLNDPLMIGGQQLSAMDFAAVYRDKILCCNNFLEAFLAIIDMCRVSPDSSSQKSIAPWAMATEIIKQKKQTGSVEEVDSKGFGKVVHMLIELLGRDMESTNPSRDKDMLVVVREGLFRVEVSGQLFGHIKTFRDLVVKHFSEAAATEFNLERHIDLTKMVAKMSAQPFAGNTQIFDLMKKTGIDMENMEMAIFGITQFLEVIRKLPMKFFMEQDYRLQILTSTQHELDKLIIREELDETESTEE